MANPDYETALRACRLMHSNNKDAAERLRLYLDEAIAAKYGNSKTITSTIKKEIIDEEPYSCNMPVSPAISSAPGSIAPIEIITSSSSTSANDSHDDKDITMMEVDDLKELLDEDLMCVVCRGMNMSARNRLVECIDCHSLYHQECHKPHISEADVNDPRLVWYCAACKQERHISASSFKSHKEKSYEGSAPASYSSKSSHSGSSSSKPSSSSSKTSSSSKSSVISSSSVIATSAKPATILTPNINIVSADKRIQNMKRKAAKQHDSSKRKHMK